MTGRQFVAIGDITTDAFIRIKDASVNCDLNRENCQLCVRFGEKVPYEEVIVVPAVGNAPNAAVAAHRLGLSSSLVTNIGDDQNGQECLAALSAEGVDTSLATTHPGMKSNYHYVLWYEEERTILVKHEEYDYSLPDIGEPTWVYLSSLGKNSQSYHQAIADYIRAQNGTSLAFQPGTFQIKFGYEALKDIYEVTRIFFSNKEEAGAILHSSTSDVKELLGGIHRLGPEIVCITDGPKGAYAYDGVDTYFTPMYPDPAPPVSRTGAGDAFASTFTAALALGKSVPEALAWGPVNSAYVVQQVGAQRGLLTRAELEKHLANAPESYAVKTL